MTNEAGLQFEGVPSERALRAREAATELMGLHNLNDWHDKHYKIVLEALELMAKEKTNG